MGPDGRKTQAQRGFVSAVGVEGGGWRWKCRVRVTVVEVEVIANLPGINF